MDVGSVYEKTCFVGYDTENGAKTVFRRAPKTAKTKGIVDLKLFNNPLLWQYRQIRGGFILNI